MSNEAKHLALLLDQRDEEIESLLSDLEALKEQYETFNTLWAQHIAHDPAEERLPVPRLEIRCTPKGRNGLDKWSSYEWMYCLVYKHLLDKVIYVPLGHTKVSGGANTEPINPDGTIDLPYRDGAHIRHDMTALNLPAFAICGNYVTPLTPLRTHDAAGETEGGAV